MGLEIERKFLVAELPENFKNLPSEKIAQGYLIEGADKSLLRIRKKGEKYYQTIKSSGGLSRQEIEIEISKGQFDTLWPLSEGKRIEKTRYYLYYNQHTIEIDIFNGKLSGLKVAEVEFEDEETAKSFSVPAWFGEDVTADNRYKNNNLAKNGIPG